MPVSLFILTINISNSFLSTLRRKVCCAAAKSCPIVLDNFAPRFGGRELVGLARKHVTSTSCSCCHSVLDGRAGKLLGFDMTINAMDGHSSVAIAANSSCSDLLMRLVDSDPDFCCFCSTCTLRDSGQGATKLFLTQTLPSIDLSKNL